MSRTASLIGQCTHKRDQKCRRHYVSRGAGVVALHAFVSAAV